MTRVQTAMITAAGPALQLVLGTVANYALKSELAMPDNARIFILLIYAISYIWAFLNLLPVLPLDGGRLLEAALGPKRIRLTLTISLIAGVGAALLAWTMYRQPFVAIFMGYFAWLSFKELQRFR